MLDELIAAELLIGPMREEELGRRLERARLLREGRCARASRRSRALIQLGAALIALGEELRRRSAPEQPAM